MKDSGQAYNVISKGYKHVLVSLVRYNRGRGTLPDGMDALGRDFTRSLPSVHNFSLCFNLIISHRYTSVLRKGKLINDLII